MSFTALGIDISSELLVLGAITGMTYGIFAVGLVLVYRSSKVVNFAHGEIGAVGAALCGLLVVRWSIPYWIALAAGAALSAGAGGITEVAVVRRLRNAPKLMTLVATLGVAQFLLAFSSVINSQVRSGSIFPQPVGLPEFKVGVLRVTQAYSAMLFIGPLLVAGLVIFLRRSRFGLAMRAAAANTDRARMAGVSATRMSTMAWSMAGAVAAFTTVLIIPTRGFVSAQTLGPVILLRALAPAVIARMTSLPIALVAGIALGVVDQVLIFNYPTSGVSEIVLLGVIACALLLQTKRGGRLVDRQEWGIVQPWRALPEAFLRVPAIRNLARVAGGLALAVAIVVGLLSTSAMAVTWSAIVAFSLLGLSLGVITGLAGQLSLGQFALAGIGGAVSLHVTRHVDGWGFLVALPCAAIATAIVSALLGLPALRVRGLLLGVVTLSFALAAQRWLFREPWMFGDGLSPGRPEFGPISFASTRHYYFWTLGVLLIGLWLASRVWKGAVGLRLRAVRDNEDGARAFGVAAPIVKIQGFAIAGVLAGLAGSVYAHMLTFVVADSFDVITSINTVALTVLGGIGILSGPLLGAFYVIGIPRIWPLDNAGTAASALGWLVLILYFPGGIAQLLSGPRRRLIHWLARRNGLDPVAIESRDTSGDTPGQIAAHTPQLRPKAGPESGGVVLRAQGLTKRYGGIRAVNEVDLSLDSGEILGLMGPNGAGKTTLFELLSGFTTPDAGRIEFAGRRIERLPPEARAHLGLIRSFQDAALFPTLTVLETVALSFERREPTKVMMSVLGRQRLERRKKDEAREIVALMGLDRFRDKQIQELSTGTRRIAELACVVALEPTVLLLDEPSSGLAQRESEALGSLLTTLRDHLACSMIVIEHDIPLLMGLSSRVMAMDSGRVIAEGSPATISEDPLVISSYLGADQIALQRSGQLTHPAGAQS